MAPAMPCTRKNRDSFWQRERHLVASPKVPMTRYGCIVESHQSTRPRAEPSQPKHHEVHIAGRGYTSMNHYNLFHKFILMPKALKIPDAKAAVDKEWKKLEMIPDRKLEKVRSKKEVGHSWSTETKKKVHFASLMDMGTWKTRSVEPKLQKYKGRVVLRGDIDQDDSGACAVFTE